MKPISSINSPTLSSNNVINSAEKPNDSGFSSILKKEKSALSNENVRPVVKNHVSDTSAKSTPTDAAVQPSSGKPEKLAKAEKEGKSTTSQKDDVSEKDEKTVSPLAAGVVPSALTQAQVPLVLDIKKDQPNTDQPEMASILKKGEKLETALSRENYGQPVAMSTANEVQLEGDTINGNLLSAGAQKENVALNTQSTLFDKVLTGALSTEESAKSMALLTENNVAKQNIPLELTALIGQQQNTAQATMPQVIAPTLRSLDWAPALGSKIVWMATTDMQSATLTLNPPDLGPMQVVLHVTNGHTNAAFTSDNPDVRQAIENALPKLKEMLADSGISLGQASVSSGSKNDARPQQQYSELKSNTARNAIASLPELSPLVIKGTSLINTIA